MRWQLYYRFCGLNCFFSTLSVYYTVLPDGNMSGFNKYCGKVL